MTPWYTQAQCFTCCRDHVCVHIFRMTLAPVPNATCNSLPDIFFQAEPVKTERSMPSAMRLVAAKAEQKHPICRFFFNSHVIGPALVGF